MLSYTWEGLQWYDHLPVLCAFSSHLEIRSVVVTHSLSAKALRAWLTNSTMPLIVLIPHGKYFAFQILLPHGTISLGRFIWNFTIDGSAFSQASNVLKYAESYALPVHILCQALWEFLLDLAIYMRSGANVGQPLISSRVWAKPYSVFEHYYQKQIRIVSTQSKLSECGLWSASEPKLVNFGIHGAVRRMWLPFCLVSLHPVASSGLSWAFSLNRDPPSRLLTSSEVLDGLIFTISCLFFSSGLSMLRGRFPSGLTVPEDS